MSHGATREGVQDTDDQGTPEMNPRNSDLESIAEAAAQARDEEMREHGIEPANTAEDAEASPSEGEPDENADTGENTSTGDIEEEVEVLKIDGQEQKVPKSKILEAGKRALQKELAADKRLEEATRLLQEAQDAAKLLDGAKTAGGQPTERGAGSDDNALPSFDAKAIVEKLQYGDTDEAAEALTQLAKSLGRSPDQVATQTEDMTPAQISTYVGIALEFREAMQKFQAPPEQGGFGDIWNEPLLRKMAIEKEAELRKAGDNRPHWELYQDVGKGIREWVQKFTGSTQKARNLNDKRERKQGIVNVGGAGAAATDTKPQAPQSPQEVIAEMRRARGQP